LEIDFVAQVDVSRRKERSGDGSHSRPFYRTESRSLL
jgi:hypothetical protein